MAAWLGFRITPNAAARWMVANPKIWIAESAALRDQIYPADDAAALSYGYVFENTPRMEMRLEQGGVRLAAYLNALFEPTGAR